jgi:hypothetical protein
MTLEGNFWRGAWYVTVANSHIALHPSSGSSDAAISYWNDVSNVITKNNYFRDGISVFSAQGFGQAGGRPESQVPFWWGKNHALVNNYAEDFGYYNWGGDVPGGPTHMSYNRPIVVGGVDGMKIHHNTFRANGTWSMLIGNYAARNGTYSQPSVRFSILGNIVTARNGSTQFPGIGATSGATSWDGVVLNGKCTPGCTLSYNILQNPSGTSQTGNFEAANGATNNALLTANNTAADDAAESTLIGFTSVSGRDFRLAPATTYKNWVATTGRDAGANMDMIESFTGRDGADVIAGIEPFSKRSHRSVTAVGSTTATIRYLDHASTCSVKVYDTDAWATPVFSGDDSGETADAAGYINLSLTSLTVSTNHWVVRNCGTDTDVFRLRTQ